jgi:hypothetical protein
MKITIKVDIDETTGDWSVDTTSKDPWGSSGNEISDVLDSVECSVKWEMMKKNLLTESEPGNITWKEFDTD